MRLKTSRCASSNRIDQSRAGFDQACSLAEVATEPVKAILMRKKYQIMRNENNE